MQRIKGEWLGLIIACTDSHSCFINRKFDSNGFDPRGKHVTMPLSEYIESGSGDARDLGIDGEISSSSSVNGILMVS